MLRRSNALRTILRTSYQEKLVFTPVGSISPPLPAGKFQPGQFFIAKNYEYRGLVLLSQETEVIGTGPFPISIEISMINNLGVLRKEKMKTAAPTRRVTWCSAMSATH